MMQRKATIAILAWLAGAGAALGEEPARGAELPPGVELPRAEIVDPVTALEEPAETYALYLPSGYTPERRWPVVFVLDPRSRGRRAAELFRAGAERFGYIVISSNSTRSDTAGGESPNPRAMQALLRDAESRFAADGRRVYLAGFSGTARYAWAVGFSLKGVVAGVIGCGGALPGALEQWGPVEFAFFGAAGETDFNHREMRRLDDALDETATPHRFEFFAGGHQWAPPELLAEALGWLELQAIRTGRRAPDGSLIEELWAAGAAAAADLEAGGEPYAAFRRWRQLAEDFDGLRDIAPAQAAAARLEQLPRVVRDGAAIRAAVDRETAYRGRLDAGLARIETLRPVPPARVVISQLQIPQLRKKAAGDSIAASSARRQLETAFVHTIFYLPRRLLAAGQPERAIVSLQVAAEIKPDHWRPWYSLAAAYARAGRKKKAVAALERAVAAGYTDRGRIEGDEDLEPIRGEAGYRRIVEKLGR